MCVITTKTVTLAIKGKNALQSVGIGGEAVSLDRNLTEKGCAYGISFPCEKKAEAKQIMKAQRIAYGQIIGGGYDR